MKCFFVVCAILANNSFCQAEVRSTKPFKDCIFVGNNSSSVQLLFDDFNETYTRDNCYELINDNKIAQNVTFLKFSGFKFNDTQDSELKTTSGEKDLEEIANTFKELRALDISNNPTFNLEYVSSKFNNLRFLNASHNDIEY